MSEQSKPKPQIVILGAGLGGVVAAFEIADAVGNRADITVIADSPVFSFVPSNPWVAVHWREPKAIQVDLAPILARKEIGFSTIGAMRVDPAQNRVEAGDGSSVSYDYLVVATGPDLAFDEFEGLGPDGHTRLTGIRTTPPRPTPTRPSAV